MGVRIVLIDVCTIYSSKQDILSTNEIENNRNIGGNNSLLVCRPFFGLNVKIPTSGGSSSSRQKIFRKIKKIEAAGKCSGPKKA